MKNIVYFLILSVLSCKNSGKTITEQDSNLLYGTERTLTDSIALVYINDEGKIGLLGTHQSGQAVTLFNKVTGATYVGKTGLIKLETETIFDSLIYTYFDKQLDKSLHEQILTTAIIGRGIRNIKLPRINTNNQSAVINKFDKRIRDEGQLDKALRDVEIKSIEKEYLDSLKGRKPKIIEVKCSFASFQIIEYRSPVSEDMAGPRFVHLNSKIYPLTGPCSSELFIYEDQDRVFISAGAGGCEDGVYIQYVYEVKGDQLIEIFADASLSK